MNSTINSLESVLRPRTTRETLRNWKTMESAFNGGDNFKRDFLWRYEREDDTDWSLRLQRSVYENHLRDLISRREAILFGRRINRSVKSDSLPWREISDNIDGHKNSWQDFIRKCFVHSQLYGFAAVIVDTPSTNSMTALDDQQNDIRPYLRLLNPQRLINWSMNELGKFEWIVIQTSEKPCRKQLITPEEIYTFEADSSDNKRPVEIKENTTGVVPIAILSDLMSQEDTLGCSSLQSACELSILYFNQSNWYDQLLYKTNYSTLAATPFAGSHEEGEIVVGSGDVFWVPEGGMVPKWISPDTGPADVFERRLAYMRRRIYELATLDVGHVEDKTRDLSGMAYSVRRLPTEEMALRLARNLKRFEENLVTTIYKTAGCRATVEIRYPQRYGVRPLRDAMKDIETIEHSTLLPKELKAYIASQIVFTEGFADLTDERQQEFEKLVFNHSKESGGETEDVQP